MAGKDALVKFFLLTCNHNLGEKVRLIEPPYGLGLLQHLIYDPGNACGGMTDLQTIADAALSVVPERSL